MSHYPPNPPPSVPGGNGNGNGNGAQHYYRLPEEETDTNPHGFPPVSGQQSQPAQSAHYPGNVVGRVIEGGGNEVLEEAPNEPLTSDAHVIRRTKKRHNLSGAELRATLILAAVIAGVSGCIGSYILLNAMFPGIPSGGWFGSLMLSMIIGAMCTGLGLDGAYRVLTDPGERVDHKSTRVAVVGDAFIILICLVVAALVDIGWVTGLCFGLAFLTVAIPVILRLKRGSLQECEDKIWDRMLTEFVELSPHVRESLPKGMNFRDESTRHPVLVIPEIPGLILLMVASWQIGHHAPWYVGLIFLIVGLAVGVLLFVNWYNDRLVISDSQSWRVYGVFKTEAPKNSHIDVTSAKFSIPYLSHYLAGNRYIACRYGHLKWDTSAQDDQLKDRKMVPHIIAISSFIALRKEEHERRMRGQSSDTRS